MGNIRPILVWQPCILGTLRSLKLPLNEKLEKTCGNSWQQRQSDSYGCTDSSKIKIMTGSGKHSC